MDSKDLSQTAKISWDDPLAINNISDRINFDKIIRYELKHLQRMGLKKAMNLGCYSINLAHYFKFPTLDELGPYIFIWGSSHDDGNCIRAELINESNVDYSYRGKPDFKRAESLRHSSTQPSSNTG